ncbi:DUF4255 domain-containing protein [Micromonospora arborensis]|uniref:DUF4255 domain-containing protein n=1 Tax=Micromonospora arborensis TaxID=2116518 RepID=UPI003408A1BF
MTHRRRRYEESGKSDESGNKSERAQIQSLLVAGFRSIAAVGRSIELALSAGFATEEPVETHATRVQLVRTEDFDPASPTLVRPALSVLLYRVDFNKTMRASWSSVGAVDGRVYLPVDLHFLLTAWADNAAHEHQVIGRAMQILEELGALSGPLLHPDGDWTPNEAVQLYLEDISTDDLMRTFDSLTCDFRLSIPYVARVVVVSTRDGAPLPDVLTHVQGLRLDLADGGARTVGATP